MRKSIISLFIFATIIFMVLYLLKSNPERYACNNFNEQLSLTSKNSLTSSQNEKLISAMYEEREKSVVYNILCKR